MARHLLWVAAKFTVLLGLGYLVAGWAARTALNGGAP